MERTVPSTASDEIELYLRTFYSLMRTTTDVQLRTLEEVHAGMNSLLHPHARLDTPDMSAFIYSLLRLPENIHEIRTVVLGQSLEVFAQHGFDCVECWPIVGARARRRRCFADGNGTLACLIASRSDIDDIGPTLVAFQIEWNKIHRLLERALKPDEVKQKAKDPANDVYLAEILRISEDDLARLKFVWDDRFPDYMELLARKPVSIGLRLLSGSASEYRRATHAWWRNIARTAPEVSRRPVYFVSSNMHSLVNLLTGFALKKQAELIDYLQQSGSQDLLEEWQEIQSRPDKQGRENFLYYVLKRVQQTDPQGKLAQEQNAAEAYLGIQRVPSEHYFDVDVQVIYLNTLDLEAIDPRLKVGGFEKLLHSDALIINIDYPLGLAAYNILTKIAEQVSPILGVYIMGKAATLNGILGDVMIPSVVHDEHSLNTYLFQNAFSGAEVSPYLNFGTVLDNQKSVSVAGTFLQNARYMDVFYREGYTDIEMEAGPYLSAVYEMYRPIRHPVNEIVNLYGVPFEIGILHYASDTPLGKGKNLGAGTLSYFGMDSTYAASVAILRRIFAQEIERIEGNLRRNH
jgi:hypothetical protein